MGQLDYLFYRVGDNDGEFPPDTGVFVRMHTGEVLPVAGAEGIELGFVSPWGAINVPMSAIEWLRYVKDPSPRYRVSLSDGSQLTVFLDPVELKVEAGDLGEVSFGAAEMAAMWGAEVELPKDFEDAEGVSEITEIPKALSQGACLLSGSNLIAGRIAQAELHVLTGSTVTNVKSADVMRMTRNGEGSELSPVFTIELSGGDEITGILQERVLDVQSGDLTWRVPVQHFLATRSQGDGETEEEVEAVEEVEEEEESASASGGAPSSVAAGGRGSRRVVLPPPPTPQP